MNRIKEVMKEQGRSQSWLCEKMNKQQPAVSRWYNNKEQPHLNTLFEIANIVGVKAYTLIGDYEPPKKEQE